jgi:hypothetical protein
MTPIDMELALLDSAEYLYSRELWEPRDNSLQLVVEERWDWPFAQERCE